MFKIDLSDTYEYPVKFHIIGPKGQRQAHTITLTFKRLTREEIVELNRGAAEQGDRSGLDVIEGDLDYLTQFVDGWKGVDINGDQTYSRDNLGVLLNRVPGIHTAITMAFLESATGALQQKN